MHPLYITDARGIEDSLALDASMKQHSTNGIRRLLGIFTLLPDVQATAVAGQRNWQGKRQRHARMTTIQNEIVEQLLAKLAADKVMDAERLTKFRDLITTGKVKVEDLIALFSMPFAEVK